MPAEEHEAATARLLDLVPSGHERVDRPGGVELAVYVEARQLGAVRAAFSPVTVRAVPDGWETAWQGFHSGCRVGPLWVGPPWEEPPAGAISVVIDPGRAFGTGSHATTRLCLMHLLELPPASLLDVGSGSGVLAIAAAKLRFAPVTAVDVDEAAVEETRRNAAANGVSLAACRADALVDPLPRAEIAVANIALEPLRALAGRLHARYLVTSGYLAGERACLPSFRCVRRVELDGWAAEIHRRE